MTGATVGDRPTYPLTWIRADMKNLKQSELAKRAGLHVNTVHYIETKKWESIELPTAVAIYKALNEIREELNMTPLKFRDINWGIPVQGSGDLPPL